jgi:2-polyprenyl-6-methoxyphenol hydroxylase-like FAD-dependent oxidoreductase
MTKPILISGAGIASLLLARSLRRSNIPFRVYERDASIVFRAQGYRLRLSSDGLDAIENVLGPQGFQKFYDACGKTGGAGFAAIDPLTGETLENHTSVASEPLTSRDGKVVGISRGDMRSLFLEGCEDNVHWSSHITGYERTDEAAHQRRHQGVRPWLAGHPRPGPHQRLQDIGRGRIPYGRREDKP